MSHSFKTTVTFSQTDSQETRVQVSLTKEKAQSLLDYLVKKSESSEVTDYEFGMSHCWLHLKDNNSFMGYRTVSVCLDSQTLSVILPNEPEGDDILDGMHPHWSAPSEHFWLRALPSLKELLVQK